MKRILKWIYIGIAIFVILAGSKAYYDIINVYPLPVEDMGHVHTWLELRVRALFGAIQLFFFSIDTDAVTGWLQYAPKDSSEAPIQWLHCLSIVAGFWTVLFVAWILAKAWWMNIRRFWHSLLHRKNLYILWGINSRSVQLAKELEGPEAYTLFVVGQTENEDELKGGMDSLLHQGRRRVQLHRALEGANASVFIAEKKLIDTELTRRAWREMGIGMLRRFVKRSENVHFLLLGDNEIENIYTAIRLSDKKLWEGVNSKITVHCHARRNNINRTIEHQDEHYPITVIDSSHLSIEILKKDVKNHPIQFVDLSTEAPGTVSSDFRSLIIGFSESGQDALRFLYEFGAFVADKDKNGDTRSAFYCDIVDRHFGPSAQRWMNHATRLFDEKKMDPSVHIGVHETDYRSDKFYNEILKPALENKLNYVVIALGEDQAGIALAADILRYASVMGRVTMDAPEGDQPTSQRFRIYVRSYEASMHDYLCGIAERYKPFIVIFGAEEEMYTKRMLIDNELKQNAMNYYYNYEKTVAEHMHWNFDASLSPDQLWEERRIKFTKDDSLEKLLDLRRRESQDYANALHEATKKVLYANGAPELRLAQTEHLRWLAAHELIGFRYGEKRNILRYVHESMLPWSQLSDDTRQYDYLTLTNVINPQV